MKTNVDFILIMKWRLNGFYWNVREFLTETIPFVWLKIWHKPIYWSQWSRDCDMCEATYSGIAYGMKHYDQIQDSAYENAEGPMSFDIISKEEYDNFKSSRRDRIMEAYENGNGNSIYV